MTEKQSKNYSKWIGVAGLLIPPISILMMLKITNVSEIFSIVLLILTGICFLAPVFVGFYLFFKFSQNKSYLDLLLAILNIFSPVWLLILLVLTVFGDAKDF